MWWFFLDKRESLPISLRKPETTKYHPLLTTQQVLRQTTCQFFTKLNTSSLINGRENKGKLQTQNKQRPRKEEDSIAANFLHPSYQDQTTVFASDCIFHHFLSLLLLVFLLPSSFIYSYIISLGVHEIQLLLDPNTSIATLSSTFVQNSNQLLASPFTCNKLQQLI